MSIGKEDKLIVIACSTGGPQALKSIVPRLPKDIDAPVVVIVHMPKGFTKSMAARLDEISEISVEEAYDGAIIEKGKAYVAPSGSQLNYSRENGVNYFRLSKERHITGLAPCADIFIESLASSNYSNIIISVLTGMGKDGSEGIRILKEHKNVYAITQNKESCVIYGMPNSVVKLGLSDCEIDLELISKEIIRCMEVL